MQASLGGQAPLVVNVVIAVQVVIEQGETLDDELAVVGDAATDVPRMILGKQVVLDVEGNVHRFINGAFSPVFPQRNGGHVAAAQTEFEDPMDIAVAEVEHCVELLIFIRWEKPVEITVLKEKLSCRDLREVDLIGYIQGKTVLRSGQQPDVETEIVGQLEVGADGEVGPGVLRAVVVVFSVGPDVLGIGGEYRQKQKS